MDHRPWTFYSKAMKIRIVILAALYLVLPNALAEVRLPVIFQSHMVLQRGKPIQIWGWADPNEKISVQLNGRSGSTIADKNGKWRSQLPALEAGGPYDLIIEGRNTITLNDVLIGDVWI